MTSTEHKETSTRTKQFFFKKLEKQCTTFPHCGFIDSLARAEQLRSYIDELHNEIDDGLCELIHFQTTSENKKKVGTQVFCNIRSLNAYEAELKQIELSIEQAKIEFTIAIINSCITSPRSSLSCVRAFEEPGKTRGGVKTLCKEHKKTMRKYFKNHMN